MSNRAHILVVDDNPSRCNWILHVLGTLPYSVAAVPSAHQGLWSLRKIRPSAVVVGGELRGRSLQRFQAVMRQRYPDIPVVVASGAWPVGRDVTTMSPGAYHCLLLCAQSQEAGLRATVRKALEPQSDSVRTSADLAMKRYACA
jgi:DNA-binding NtrC family response regulator